MIVTLQLFYLQRFAIKNVADKLISSNICMNSDKIVLITILNTPSYCDKHGILPEV